MFFKKTLGSEMLHIKCQDNGLMRQVKQNIYMPILVFLRDFNFDTIFRNLFSSARCQFSLCCLLTKVRDHYCFDREIDKNCYET